MVNFQVKEANCSDYKARLLFLLLQLYSVQSIAQIVSVDHRSKYLCTCEVAWLAALCVALN